MPRKGKARVLSLEEFRRAEDACLYMRYSYRNRAILYLAFGLGLRACEIRDLTLRDVLNQDGITLKETVNLVRTKGNKAREIYFTNIKLINVLNDHIKDMKDSLRYKLMRFSLDLPLFLSQKKSFFAKNQIVELFSRIFKLAKIEGAKSHSGRRTFITNRIDEGCDMKSIADLVGHKNIMMTLRYHQSNPSRLKKIAEKSIF